jgi:mRNA interferase MazF
MLNAMEARTAAPLLTTSCVNVVPSEQNGVDVARRIDLTQIRAVDKSRITSRKGLLEKEYYCAISRAIKTVLAQ